MTRNQEMRNLALPALRERVMDDLASQFAAENIGLDEYDERCGKAAAALKREELLSLLEDLPDLSLPALTGSRLPSTSDRSAPSVNSGSVRDLEPIINVFFGTERKGVWKPARNTLTVNVFGGTDLDLRKAILPPGGCTIQAVCVFGGCDVIVPEGVRVEVSGIGIFGGFSKSVEENEHDDDLPLVRVVGVAVFGGVEVKGKKKR